MTDLSIDLIAQYGISAIALYLIYNLAYTVILNNNKALQEIKEVLAKLCEKLEDR